MLMIGDRLNSYTIAAGEPWIMSVQMRANAGNAIIDWSQRRLVLSFYTADRALKVQIEGVYTSDASGAYFAFVRDGSFSESLFGNSLQVELAERLLNGRAIIATGPLSVVPTSQGVTTFGAIIGRADARFTIYFSPAGLISLIEQEILPYNVPIVAPPVTLGTLSLSGTLRVGTASNGTISGATDGSTITENIAGFTANSSARTYAYDGTGSAATIADGLTETHPNATNSPRQSAVTVAAAPVTLSALSLAANSVTENAASGTVVGGILGKTSGSTLSLFNDDGGRFAISGTNLVAGLTNIDYEAGASRSIVLRETLTGATNSPRDTSLAVGVVNVLEQPSLRALLLSTTSLTIGTPATGAITEAATGSTITASGLPAGYTVNGPARTWAYDGSGPAATSTVTLTETLGDSPNSPRATQIVVTIAAADADLVLSSNPASGVTSVAGPVASINAMDTGNLVNFIQARMSGSTVTGAVVSAGLLPDGHGFRSFRLVDAESSHGVNRNADGTYGVDDPFPLRTPLPNNQMVVAGDSIRMDRTTDAFIWSLIKADGTVVQVYTEPAASGSAFFGQLVALGAASGVTYSNITYGAYNPSIAVLSPDFDPFTRTLNTDVSYSNPAGVPNDYAEISLNGGAWQRARNSANPSPGLATVSLANIPTTFSGTTPGRIRWHNNPSDVVAFTFEAVLPFAGSFGMNVAAYDTQSLNDIGGFGTFASNGAQGQGSIAYLNGFGQFPSSLDGAGGTVQRDRLGGIGVNSLGITHYRFFREFKADTTTAGNYEMLIAPGAVVSLDNFAPLPNYAYNQATGVMTFSLTNVTSNTLIGFHVQVSSIPSGTIINPVFRKVGASGKYNMAQINAVKSTANFMRNMDGSGINNANNNTRTVTTLPKRTLANTGNSQFVGDVEFAKLCSFTRYLAINSHIDDETYVQAHAEYVAANWPINLPVDVSNFNEIWNFIFGHFYDFHLEGVRRGYGPLEATPSTLVPMTVLDAGGGDMLGGGVFTNCDANGVVQSDGNLNTSIKTTRALNQGDKFVRNVGGVRLFGAKVAIPANTVTQYEKIRDSQDPNYEELQPDAWVNRAAKRWAATLAKRNIQIWKTAFAAAGRPAPRFLIEGRVGEPGYAFDMLNWDGLADEIRYNTEGPYISGGFSFDYMDWTRTDLWDTQARQYIADGNYTAAIEMVIPKAVPQVKLLGVALRQSKTLQRAYNVSKFGDAGRDRIGSYFYEWGDHFGYVRSNWPDDGKAKAFWRTFRTHPLYYTLFTAYLNMGARIGAPAHWYRGAVSAGDTFSLYENTADTDVSGAVGSNQRLRALRDMKAKVDQAVAQYAS